MLSRRHRTLVVASALVLLAGFAAGCDPTVGDDDIYDPHASTGRDAATSPAPDATATSADGSGGGDGGGSRDGGGDGGGARDGAASDAAAAAVAAFGSICTVNANCQSNLCFAFGQGGSACTLACTPANAAAVCPPVGGVNLGCNGMGVCKVR